MAAISHVTERVDLQEWRGEKKITTVSFCSFLLQNKMLNFKRALKILVRRMKITGPEQVSSLAS